ncbi:hypothetical protein [Cytobacillus dafuensis]|uniref:Uncharacterized protein n=1 Tax=Cytobacillus dafuensis TaxID=1742359 RepID=A0A5B8Z8E6_CYTDA|nr:hypothetical protein [Cytobacillus dafuensis]QED49365.1 hypothetical protein FSZ17_20025 [Cytobacillus dafuensis]
MTFLMLFGFLFVIFLLLNKQRLVRLVGTNNRLVQRLSNLKWFQNEWSSGIFLFFLNALLFALAIGAIYVLGLLNIPYLHIFIMLLAALLSIYLWIVIHNSGSKGKKEQLIMGSIGSSFYLLLLLVCIYLIMTLEPSTPEHDTFMAFIGLIFASFISFIAMSACFYITGFSKNQINGKR